VFNTPIHLNGDKDDNRADNLTLRPLWFAREYHKQFESPPRGLRIPVEITNGVGLGEFFKTSWDAAIKYGLLDREILIATLNQMYVFPTYQRFRVV
jgi:hypothetical protein